MKKRRIHIFSAILGALPLLFVLGLIWIQTPQGNEWVKGRLVKAAASQGITLSVDEIQGQFLPIDWKLKGVNASLDDEEISFENLRIRFALSPLLKRELDLSFFKGSGGRYKGHEFTVSTSARLDLRGRKSLKVEHFLLEGDDLFVRFEGKLGKDWIPKKGTVSFSIPEIGLFAQELASGQVQGSAYFNDGKAEALLTGYELNIQDLPMAPTTLSFKAEKLRKVWEGQLEFTGGHRDVSLSGKAHLIAPDSFEKIEIQSLSFEGPDAFLYGHLDVETQTKLLNGVLLGQCNDLRAFRPLLPNSLLKGQLGFKVDLASSGPIQDIAVQLEVDDFSAFETNCKTLIVEGNLSDLFGELKGSCSLEGRQLQHEETHLSLIEIKSNIDPHSSPFSITLDGKPLSLRAKGEWQKRGSGIYFAFNELFGDAFNNRFNLNDPFSLEWNSDHFKMSNFSLDVGTGHLFSRIDLSPSTTLIKVQGKQLPLELFPFPSKYFSLQGIGNLDIDFISWQNNIQGTCRATVERAHIHSDGTHEPLTTKGSIQINLSDARAQVYGELKAKGGQFLHLYGSLPITYHHFPFRLTIDPDKPLTGQLIGEGKVEDLCDFINIGSHRLEGWLSTELHFCKTLANPSLQGTFEWQDGLYENYYTGTTLRGIEAKGRASHQSLLINELIANDGDEGTIFATGEIQLKKHLPFSITGQLDNLTTVSFDTIAGKFSGEVTISGDQRGATARGTLNVIDATMQIPDELPVNLPLLPITFVNPPEHLINRKAPPPPSSPLRLDLTVKAPGKICVEGRGLHSELKGKLHLTGTYTDMVASGKLQLIKGEFLFSGKVFNLTSGELIFQDTPTPSSFISLSGTCDLPDVAVTVHLRGPLSSPKLSFQSNPALPTSSLLSQILFNKDISEISAVQALQVAQTVIALSGSNAPDILEKIRKTLGIDRLTLVTSDNDPGNLSLQIGKYLMRGVLLTLSRGVETQDVAVEVDLKKGFTLQAEVNEDQQGKFSLKWNHHY